MQVLLFTRTYLFTRIVKKVRSVFPSHKNKASNRVQNRAVIIFVCGLWTGGVFPMSISRLRCMKRVVCYVSNEPVHYFKLNKF